MTSLPAAPPRTLTATANLTRLLCIAVACAAGIFGLLSLGPFLTQAWQPTPVVAALAWAFSFGLPVALGLCARWGSPRLLRAIVAAEAVCFVLVAVFWLVVRGEPLPAGADVPWAITHTGVPCVAVAVFARRWVAWSFTALACFLSGAVRFLTSADANPALVGLADGLYSLLLVSVFVAFTLAARQAAARVDDATLLTRHAEARRAARVSRRQERLRIDALVHDSVISTLLMAGLGRTPPTVVSDHASKTLSQLDALRSPPVEPVVLVSDVVRRIRRLVRQLAPDATMDFDDPSRGGGFVERTVPSVAVAALLGAVGEALRNSVASAAGPGRPARRVHRAVQVVSTTEGFQVTVSDDGVGFSPAGVPPERLGIAESIVGRMERVPHGAANVRSSPGSGTDIVLAWAPARGTSTARPGPAADRRAAKRMPEPPAADDIEPISLTRSLDLSAPLARLILALFVLVHGVLAIIDLVPGRPLPLMMLAYVAIVYAGTLLMSPIDGAFPRARIAVVLGLSLTGAVLMFAYLPADSGAPFAHWHLGAITLILVVLAARGQIRSAWLGYALLALLAVGWAVATGQSAAAGVNLVIRHAGTLLAGTLFVVGLDRTEAVLRVLTHSDTTQAARIATTVAAIDEREAELVRVNLLARPTLQRLAAPHALTPAERAQCLLVEASLRDAIRGRSLFVEPVISAVNQARRRGVQVTVLDDSADSPPAELAALARTVADTLASVDHGRITVRVLPADRADVATLVIESDTHRILTVDPHGAVRTL
jgi:signal transduction histidine kinase